MNYHIKTISTVIGIFLSVIITVGHAFANSLPELYKHSGPEIDGGINYRGQVAQPQLHYGEGAADTSESLAASAVHLQEPKIILVASSDSNTPPHHSDDWGGKHYPPAEAFPRKLNAGLWQVKNDTSPANEAYAKTLQQVLEHINAVPIGQELLIKLKEKLGRGQPVGYIARLGWGTAHGAGGGNAASQMVRPINNHDGSVSLEVNTEYLKMIFDGGLGPSPAKTIRNVVMDMYRIQQGNRTNSDSSNGHFVNEMRAALAGDQFYGELTVGNHDGTAFNYGLNSVLGMEGVPLARMTGVWPLREMMYSKRVVNGMEVMEPSWVPTYIEAVESNLHGGERLPFELVKVGGIGTEFKTPLRVVLNTLDTRVAWGSVEVLNKTLRDLGALHLQIDNNSLLLRNAASDARALGTMNTLASAITESPFFIIEKAGREGLMNRVMETLHQLVTIDRKYSAADVKAMARGLQLPQRLQTFIDDLGNDRVPRPQSSLAQPKKRPTVAKLQFSTN